MRDSERSGDERQSEMPDDMAGARSVPADVALPAQSAWESATDWDAAIRDALRSERLSRGWSLREAATRSEHGLRPTTLGAYERGDRRMTLTVLYELADLYEIPARSFIPREVADRVTAVQVIRVLESLSDRHRSLVAALAKELAAMAPGTGP